MRKIVKIQGFFVREILVPVPKLGLYVSVLGRCGLFDGKFFGVLGLGSDVTE